MKNPEKSKLETGNSGEDLACQFLLAKGYELLEKNYRFGHFEIDLIMAENDTIIFIEVKTRFSPIDDPERAVTRAKQRNIARAAEAYLYSNAKYNSHRFDILSVELKYQKEAEIIHFIDAFYPFYFA